MKLISWNVNGIRAAHRGGFADWLKNENADIVGVQEIKAHPDQLEEELKTPPGYHSFWHPAIKPGYSGVALFCKKEPLRIQIGIGIPEIDAEGRVIVAEYTDFVLINAYFPNSQREGVRLPYKLLFCQKMVEFCEQFKAQGKNVVLCGDLNIAHKAIDLKNPKANEKNAGYLPEERAWLDQLSGKGYIDAFRHFTKEGDHYTWWSYRPGIRDRNIGWRIDSFWVNGEFEDHLKNTVHQPHIRGSDHCPVVLTLRE